MKSNFLQNKKYGKILITFFLALFVFLPFISEAAGLVPCGGKGEEFCTLCHFIIGIQGVMKWGLGIAVIVGIAIITFAGVLYIVSTGDPGLITRAKDAIKNTVIGIFVMVSAWLIINYGMLLVGAKSNVVGTWYKFDASCITR